LKTASTTAIPYQKILS